MTQIKKGKHYANTVMSNRHPYSLIARDKHPEPQLEWIERTLIAPDTMAVDSENIGRVIYYKYIPEAGAGKWLLVIVQDDQFFNAYFNKDLLKRWGRPQ